MNIVVAPDSYKGSLTSIEAAKTIKDAILQQHKNYNVVMKPMADGGEGTLELFLASIAGEKRELICTGPIGEQISIHYAIIHEKTAVIEYANIAGLTQVPAKQRNPDTTTSFGMGEVIMDALEQGCTSFVLGIGGSATNDGGLGMLLALGMEAWDEAENELGPYGKDLLNVHRISFENLDSRLAKAHIKVACDVDNPLCGKKGASAIYGPQKGTSIKQVTEYDNALDYFGNLVENICKQQYKNIPGAGAAGGIGFALLTIGAQLVSGAELVGESINVEKAIQQADLVITGEGQSDEQTLYGKAPGHIALLAKKYQVPVVLVSGSLQGDIDVLHEQFSGCFSIINQPITLETSMEQADILLAQQTKQVIHFMRSIIKKG